MNLQRIKPLLIFDGDCGFCMHWIERWKRLTGDQVDYAPYQQVGAQFPDISIQEFEKSVIWIGRDGTRSRAAEAVFKTLAENSAWRWPLSLYRNLPGFASLTEAAYRLVAKNRGFFSKISP